MARRSIPLSPVSLNVGVFYGLQKANNKGKKDGNVVDKVEIYVQQYEHFQKMLQEKTMKNDQKREKFVKLANARVAKTLKDLQLIGNLANKRAYAYNENDVKLIFKAIDTEMSIVRDRFRSGTDKTNGLFKLEA